MPVLVRYDALLGENTGTPVEVPGLRLHGMQAGASHGAMARMQYV